MIDLSFLTEAEQEAILKVLQRDAELKKSEEQRVRQLQDETDDENELKYKSGQWFYEAKSKRHRDKIHGADLVRASIRKRKSPATIAELSQSSKNKSQRRWVNSINQDLFIPPELYGVMESPDETEEDLMSSKTEPNQSAKKVSLNSTNTDKDILKNGTASPAKQRKNPFNSEGVVGETVLDNEVPNQSPEAGQVNGQKEKRNLMSSIYKYGVKLPYPEPIGGRQTSPEAEDDPLTKHRPVPKPRKLVINGQPPDRSNSSVQREDSFNGTNKPKGILKRRSSSSSTDSESIRFPQNVEPIKLVLPSSPILEAEQTHLFDNQVTSLENSPDRQKQVRFSENVLQKPPTPNPESYNAREFGEFGILDHGSYQKELDYDFVDHPHYEESKPTQYSYSDVNHVNPTEVLGQSSLKEDPSVSLTIQTPSNSAPILDAQKKLEDPSQGVNNGEYEILDESYPEININSAGPEPLYATVKKPSKSTSSDKEKDFDLDDAFMEPRFLGQRGKIENTYQNEKPLEFGKSYGGAGKINYGSPYTASQPGEVYVSTNEDVLAPKRASNVQSSNPDFVDRPYFKTPDSDYVPKWRRPYTLENEDLSQPRAVQEFPNVNSGEHADTFVKPDSENGINSKYSPGEYKIDTRNKSILLRNTPEVGGRQITPLSNFPVAQNMPFSSTPVSEGFQTHEMFLLENRERKDLPKSANFKVMSMKERIHDTPREQMGSNPSQFQSLKHFWNVEDKNQSKADVDTSPNRMLKDILKRNKPIQADLKQRNSKEIPAEDLSLPGSFDSLSEEEQTSQKVASWLAQTPTVYVAEQVDANENQVHPGEDVMENIEKTQVDRNNQDEEFSSALQKLAEEALDTPKITDTKHPKSEAAQISPYEEPDLPDWKKTSPAILVSSAEKRPASGFYERVVQITSTKSPAKETEIVVDAPTRSFQQYPEEVQEQVDKTEAPAKTANEFKIGFQKLMEEYQSMSSDDEHQEESNLPSKEQQQIETEEITEKSSIPKGNDHQEFISALKKLEVEASTQPIIEDQVAEPETVQSLNTVSPMKSSFKIGFEHLTPVESIETEENIERSSIPKGNDHQEFISALEKLEVEASTQPIIEDQVAEPETVQSLNTVSPMKSSFKIGFEPFTPVEGDTADSPQKRNVTYTVQSSPPYDKDTNGIEEVVERTTEPSRKDENDFREALGKLEHEAAINDPSTEVEDTYEEPKMTPTLQSTRSLSTVQNMPSPSHSVENESDLEDPYPYTTGNSAEDTYVISERERPKSTFNGQEKLPVEEETIEKTIIDTQESSADYRKQIMRLEEEAALVPEEPKDLSHGETFYVSQAPTKEVFISKKVFSSQESMPTELPSSSGMPKDLSQPPPYAYKELANSPSDQSGSFTGSAENVLYKKPDTSSEVSKSKKGKPAPSGSPNDSDSSRHDRYTFEGMKAQDESISKVLEWFGRSSDSVDDQSPSVGLLEKSKTSPQTITYPDKTEESPGPNVDNLANGNETTQKMKSISKMSWIPESKEDIKNVDLDQPKILKMNALSSIEDESIPPQQVPLTDILEFGKSGSGCGKTQSTSINGDPLQKSPQLPVRVVIEKDNEGSEAEREDSSILKEDVGNTEGMPDDEKKDQIEVLTPTLEENEDQISEKTEKDKPIVLQKRVSDIKLLWEGDRPSQDTSKKSVLSNVKHPVEISITPKSSSLDSDDQNNGSLVTFKKVIVEDEEDPLPHVNQLKSFWENEKNKDATKGKQERPYLTNESSSDDKEAPMADPRSKFQKRHTVHKFFEKQKSTELEKNLPGRSVSLSESANESLKDRIKSTSFQNLKNFWNISSKSDDKRSSQALPENMTKQFGSNPDLRSNETLISRVKSRLAAKSLQDIREDPSAVSQFQAYDAEPMPRKFGKRYSKKEDPKNPLNKTEIETNPSNTRVGNNKLEKPISSVDLMLQESSVPSNYPKSSSTISDECDTEYRPDISDEKQTPLTVIENSVAPKKVSKSEISPKLKTSQDEVLPEESPESTTSENGPGDQNVYRDEENGEMNERGRKMLLVKQSRFDAGSPILSNVSEPLQENEKNLSENEYPSGDDEVSNSREVVDENIEKTVIPLKKDSSDFDRKLQNMYNESLNTVDLQNGNLNEQEYMDIKEPDQNFSKVLAVSSGNSQSSRTSKDQQPIIINISSKKTEIDNDDLSKPQMNSPTDISLIRHSGDVPAVPDIRSNEVNITSEEPTSKLKGSSSREPELNEFSSESNDNRDDSLQPEELHKKEIIERIEMPTVLPKTRFNDFNEKLKQLYKESQMSWPNLEEAADSGNVVENNEHIGVKNQDNVYLRFSEPKKTFLKSLTVNLESPQTLSADRETRTDESAPSGSQAPDILEQEVNETIEKTVAPTRISNAKSLEELQKEAMNEEEGGFIGNVSSGHVAFNESQSRLSDQGLRENSVSESFQRESEDTVQEGTEPARYEEHQEGTPETSVTFVSDRQSTPVKDQNGSLRRSTLELYLEAPYRREISKSIDFDLSGYVTTEVNKCMDESNPILRALKRSTDKTLNAKAVQEVSPTSTNQSKLNDQEEDTLGPIENSFPENAEKFKRMSQSVPTFLQDDTDGRETDSASESSFQIGRHKKSPSSLTNLSGSSGMASMSSVSGSIMSVYSGDFGNVDIKGSIEFSIDYVEQLKEFHIYIYQCKDLAAADVKKQRSDPYVKAYLLPEKAKMGKRKTAVKKKSLNPVYNEILRYKIPKQSLQVQTLNLSVWHHDALGRNSFLGDVNLNLATWDWNNTQRHWYQLEARTPASGIGLEHRGEMKLSLKYVPMSPPEVGKKLNTTGEVHIWIKDCIQLPMLRENKINSFVACTILPDTSRKSRQKTRAVDKTPNPIFNHTMVYDGFKEEDLREACVELTVWDHNKLSNRFLGGLRIGLGTGKSYGTAVDWMDSSHEESTMWEQMIASPNTWIEGLLPLRMFKMAKFAK